MVENMFQDSRGFLWFATEHGVSRYDGKKFKSYMANKSLPINKIEENERGEIVIYGYYFINILNPETEEIRQTFRNHNLNYLVHCSSGLPQGYSLITKRDIGKMAVFHLEADTLREVFYHPLFDRMYEGQSVYYDLENSLVYIPTQDNKLYIVDFTGNIKQQFNNIAVSRFLKNGDELWAVGLEGVWTVSPQKVTQKFRFPHKISNIEDIDVLLDHNGDLLVRDYKSIMRYRNGRFETIIDAVNIPRHMMFDNEGNLWFISRHGVYIFFNLDVKIYKVNEKNADIVESILPTGTGEGYFATGNGKLIFYKNEQFKEIAFPNHPNGTSFSNRATMIDDKCYFTTYQDILKLQNGHFSWLNLPPDIYHITSCRLGSNQWLVGGWNTLWILDNDGKRLSEMSQRKLNRNTFYTVQSDDNQNIWIGGHSGICRISQNDTTYFFSDTTMNAESVDKDKNGTIWFGCEENIYYTDGDTIRHFMSFDSDVLLNLCCTDDGLLVVSSNKNLKIIDIKTKNVATYDYSNGLSDCELSWNTMTKDFEGNVWIATQSPNVLKFNPRTLFERKTTTNLQIEKIEYSANNIDWKQVSDLEILNHQNKNLKISFVGLCFSNPNAVRYRYRLLGFQDEWSAPTPENEVFFTNLPNGNYEFQLIADCGSDDTQTQIISRHFSIQPAFWQTWWFLIVIILILMLLSAATALFIQQKKHRTLIAKFQVEKEFNDLKIKSIRLHSIPHFNANVLSAIEYYIMNYSKEEANRLLNIYAEFTGNTLRELEKSSRSLQEELDYALLYLKLEKLRFLDKFNYEIDIAADVNKDVQIPNMIIHTYCENAIKHGFATRSSGCILKISATNRENHVEICVEDNGIGRIASEKRNSKSTKQGLSILNRQIEIYNHFNEEKIVQKIIDLYDGDAPSGTCFIIKVPYNFTY
jgi:ligand-binding sensor domain-containing protein